MALNKSSVVWHYFEKGAQEKDIAVCRLCKSKLKYTGSSTSNLLKHLKTKHPIELSDQACPPKTTESTSSSSKTPLKQPTISAIVERTQLYGKTSERKRRLDNSVVEMIALDMQPISVVENVGFNRLSKEYDSRYVLPSRKRVTRELLPNLYQFHRQRVEELITLSNEIAITTDLWTSRATEGYITITAHFVSPTWELRTFVLNTTRVDVSHTAANIATELRHLLERWQIMDSVRYMVTDNAYNMKKAARDELKLTHIPCFAHTLNLVVQATLRNTKDVAEVQKKVKAIVSYFHQSSKATTQLKAVQGQMGTSGKKLIQDVETRWNSTAAMFRRYIELHNVVSTSLCYLGRSSMCVEEHDVNVMKQALDALEPFELATEEMSSEKSVTLSKVIPMVCQIKESLVTDVSTDSMLAKTLMEELCRRFDTIEDIFPMSASTLLDPRFKKIYFLNEGTMENTERKLCQMMQSMYSVEARNEVPDIQDQQIHEEPIPKKRSLWRRHDEKVKDLMGKAPDQMTGPSIEMRRYLESPHISREDNPLMWWKEHSVTMPHLSVIARQVLGVPATSVPSERLFSKAGELISHRRCALKPENVDMLLFLNKNIIL